MNNLYNTHVTLSKYIHIFERDNQWYAYGTWVNRIWEITPKEALIILDYLKGIPLEELYKNGNIDKKDIKSIINYFEDNCIIEECENSNFDNTIDSMILLITEKCNFACTYCYGAYGEKNKTMIFSTAKLAIDLAKKLNIPEIVFFGGEPLLNFELIKQTVKYIKEIQFDVDLRITTNGSLVTEEIASFFAENNILVSVSMDGNKEQHDKTRIYKDGSSSYEQVINGIKILKEYNLLDLIEITHSSRHDEDISAQIKGGLDLFPIISCACVDGKKGCKHYNDVISGKRLTNFYKNTLDFIENNLNESEYIFGVKELYDKICNGKTFSSPQCLCSDISSRLVISSNGDICPCPEMTNSEYVLGNINELSLEEFYIKRNEVLNALSSRKLKKEWFSGMCETCIQHVTKKDGFFFYENPLDFEKCIEDLLILYVKKNRMQ